MKKTIKLASLIMALALCLTACGGGSSAPAASAAPAASGAAAPEAPKFEKMTWKYACSATENTNWADMGRQFGKLVSEATGGAVTVEVYAADQLTAGNQAEGLQGVTAEDVREAACRYLVLEEAAELCIMPEDAMEE